ncbi:hypothetical protein AB0J40_20225 [Amycolatopsis sp. NPDC049691]|uniref:hypothetical protein n=1 Tax=Amycolatopsis sp. NPDC049691 TaxID=3155155 RepID=UPI00344980F3
MTDPENAKKPTSGGFVKRWAAALVPSTTAATFLGVVSALDQLFQHPATGSYLTLWLASAATLLLALGFSVVRAVRRKRQGRPIRVKHVVLFTFVVAISLGAGFAGGRFFFPPAADASDRTVPPAPTAAPTSPISLTSPPSSTSAPTTLPSPPTTLPGPTFEPPTTRTSKPAPPAPPGRAHIAVSGDHPGGCNTEYELSGGTDGDPATAGSTLWLVTLLLADDANGNKDHFYAKAPVGDSFAVRIAANTEPGARNSRFLLVAADATADAELRANYESDRYHTNTYSDAQRETLPPGSRVVAETPTIGQRC